MAITFFDGRATVASGGTAVQVSTSSVPFTKVTITAETDNTGIITVGASTVVASLATRRGAPLSAGDSVTIEAKGQEHGNLTNLYIDTTVNGDGVTFVGQSETHPNA